VLFVGTVHYNVESNMLPTLETLTLIMKNSPMTEMVGLRSNLRKQQSDPFMESDGKICLGISVMINSLASCVWHLPQALYKIMFSNGK
jgi:hypothetical protein